MGRIGRVKAFSGLLLAGLLAACGGEAPKETPPEPKAEAPLEKPPGKPALLLEAVGIDRAVFTPVFAAGRIGGWLAHALEQRATGRIIRPESRYVGSWPAD